MATFKGEPLTLDGSAHGALLDRLVEACISGGAAYDALIGATAAEHDALLLSRDQRATRIYALLGVRFDVVA